MADQIVGTFTAEAPLVTSLFPNLKTPFGVGDERLASITDIKALIFDTPTLVTPALGVATATSLTISGNQSVPAWTTNGVRLKSVAGTLTDTTSSGTVAAAYTNVLGGNTIAATSASTFTDYYSMFLKDPIAGTNVTLTNKWALGAESLKVTGAAAISTLLIGSAKTTMSGSATLTAASKTYQFFDPNGSNRDVTLPTPATDMEFVISHIGGANTLTIKDAGASTVTTVLAGNAVTVKYDSAIWQVFGGSGVVSVTGTANQVIASAGTGAITLSLPQSIGTSSTVVFGRLGLGITPTTNLHIVASDAVSGVGNGLQLDRGTAGFAVVGFGGRTSVAAASAMMYSDESYLVLNSKAGSPLYLNFDNTNASSTVNLFNGKVIVSNIGVTTFINGANLVFGTGAGSQIGTGSTQKMAFWGLTPVVQQVLATGASRTVDEVITFLQTIGLCKQS